MSITTETKKKDTAAKHSTESLDALLDAPQAPKRSRLSRIPLLRKLALDKDPEGQFPVETGVGFGEWVPFESKGTILRTNMRSAKSGLYAPSVPGAPSTTRQAEILNTAKIAAPTGVDGVSAGRDVLSQTPVSKDPVTDYNATPRRVTSTNALLIGDVGAGKSSYGKCGYVLRPVILRNRRAVIFDKKNEDGEGEYAQIVRFFGGQPIRYALDGSGVRLNLLDPEISGTNDDGLNNQLAFLNTVPALMRDGQGANEWERKALRLAYREVQASFESGRTPTTADLHDRIGIINPNEPSLAGFSDARLEQLHEAGASMRLVFNELLEHFGAIFDGETSAGVRLNGKVSSFDISQLPDTGPVIPMAMGLSNLWLLGRVRRDRGMRTNVIVEEAGHILGGPLALQQRSNIKLSRGLGISNIYCLHKDTDVPPGSPGMAVIEEAQTVHIFRQTREKSAQWCAETFGLNPESVSEIMSLPNGHHFLKSAADDPEIEIEHVRSDWEMKMTNTDGALVETPVEA
ncbi:MAG: ATP/GTP-binding protein [Micrococcaceae bacterium]|nr:ATP/GTP-binding protein [Micrococcaceae bacterium]